ncbi:hypothetical protein BS333_02710 [Vibrio azureus]|uniref:Uncharacterized protein n=1 Tax=Vibrio azureus NBRC 104587 TaxID=1219077 RepID=U3AT96_9VIBR|nr:hypothetical protein BS333_02710 [Vibrio azureus]GAD76462.1 hypothetical protein VAZ01S_044_00430 [Vibrio azureus NBRC 104587]
MIDYLKTSKNNYVIKQQKKHKKNIKTNNVKNNIDRLRQVKEQQYQISRREKLSRIQVKLTV